ncbi:MAG: thioredoxin family protein [Candidatus Ornithospirochaeta sp.]
MEEKKGKNVTIKVLGSGCKRCHALYANTVEAVKNLGLGISVEYITDMETVLKYGVMSMPSLVVSEKVVSTGSVLSTPKIESLLKTIL